MEHTKILPYWQYKISQALLLQQKDIENTATGITTEMLCLKYYQHYLKICGIKDPDIFSAIERYISVLRNDNDDNHQEVVNNIDDMMDDLHFEMSI